jgi:hypothetical protein
LAPSLCGSEEHLVELDHFCFLSASSPLPHLAGARRNHYSCQEHFSFFESDKVNTVKTVRLSVLCVLALTLVAALAQQATKHILSREELNKVTPAEFFFRGQKAPVQLRNAVGFQLANSNMTLAALVDASGYSTAIQQKYQGMLITENKLNIGGFELAPGEYGFGFTADGKFVVMNVASNDVFNAAFQTDHELKRPVPLKLMPDGDGYRLYAGRTWVSIKVQ